MVGSERLLEQAPGINAILTAVRRSARNRGGKRAPETG